VPTGSLPLLRRLEQGLVPRDQSRRFSGSSPVPDEVVVNVAANDTKRAAETGAGRRPSLTSDKDTARRYADFRAVGRDCYLTLTDVDDKGEGTVLFPNKFQQDNRIKAHVSAVSGRHAPFQYKGKGGDSIAVCTDRNIAVDGIVHDFKSSRYHRTGLHPLGGAVDRGRAKNTAAKAPPKPPQRRRPRYPARRSRSI
jgi:hypothetical protein